MSATVAAVECENVVVADHPLMRTKLSIIRDRRTDSKLFRELVYEIGLYVGYQATRTLKTAANTNVRPLAAPAQQLPDARRLCAGRGRVWPLCGAPPGQPRRLCAHHAWRHQHDAV